MSPSSAIAIRDRTDAVTPNNVEREALSNPLTVEFDDTTIHISSIELQIAYKLRLAQAADRF